MLFFTFKLVLPLFPQVNTEGVRLGTVFKQDTLTLKTSYSLPFLSLMLLDLT